MNRNITRFTFSNTYGIAFSLTSCRGLTGNAVVLLGLMVFDVRITGVDAVFICVVMLGVVTLECVVIVGDTGWDGMLPVVRLEGTPCCCCCCWMLFCIRGWDVTFEGIV